MRKSHSYDSVYSYRYIDPTLAAYVGETVTIRYDPRDLAVIRVFYQERFLCQAVCSELAGQTVSLKETCGGRMLHRYSPTGTTSATASTDTIPFSV